MPGEVHCLDELATELDAAISRLERIVAALADARPVVTGPCSHRHDDHALTEA